jgi:tetratricopeptide (TPR) repeat protein
MMRVYPVLVFAFWVLNASVARGEDVGLGIRPSGPDPAADYTLLTHDDRWARIDSLDAPLARGEEISTVDRIELVRLLRFSPLMKHRVRALELLPGLEGRTLWRETILTYNRTFNPWDAAQLLEKWIEAFPNDVEPHLRMGLLRLEEGVDEASDEALADAEENFRHMVELAPEDPEGWRGLAVILIWQNRPQELLEIADALVDLTPELPGPRLLRALAFEATGSEYRASSAWEQAFARMDPSTLRRFEDPDRIRIVRPEALFVDELIVKVPPLKERGWWVRVTEAETLFARPERGVRSWDSACGQAWMLYGRPKFMRWLPQSDIGFASGDPGLTRYRQKILAQLPFKGNAQHATPDSWVWLVRVTRNFDFPVVFQRETRFATWQFDERVENTIISEQTARGPVRLEASVPPVVRTDGGVEIDVAVHGFRAFLSSGGRLRIEAWVATRADVKGAVDALRMVVATVEGREVDRVVQPIDDAHRSDTLALAVPGFENHAEGWIHGFGTLLPAGEYLVVIDALDAAAKVVATRDGRVRIDAGVVAREGFDISEPLVCDAYSEMGRFGALPPEFVRHARAVVPNPSRRLKPNQQSVAVYYEVYGATIDAAGQSHLDVEYTVFAVRAFDPVLRAAAYVDGKLASPDIHLSFLDSRSGVAAGGLVVRGTRLDVSELEAGNYVLTVRVSDTLARREAERNIRFVVDGSGQ